MGGVGRSPRPTNRYKLYSDSAIAKADPPRRYAPPLLGGEFSEIAQIPKTRLSKEREEMESHP
jgi:hypothetical protein